MDNKKVSEQDTKEEKEINKDPRKDLKLITNGKEDLYKYLKPPSNFHF